MRKNLMLEQIEQILVPIVADAEVALVDVDLVKETGRHFLRVFIDKPGGIGTDDCEKVSRALDAALEQNELIPMAYTMEVSSPGLGRTLRKDREFVHFSGRKIDVSLFAPCVAGRKFTATLLGIEGRTVSLELEDGRMLSLPRTQIARASLALSVEGGEPT